MKRLQQKKSKRKIIIIVVIAMIVTACGVVGYILSRQNEPTGNNTAANNSSSNNKSENSSSQTNQQKDDTEPKPDLSKEYAPINEMSVQYQVTPATKTLVYAHLDSANGDIATISFSTKAMSKAKDERGNTPCSDKKAPSGMISRYKDGTTKIGFSEQTIADVGKKVGDFYYLYSEPRFTCNAIGVTAEDIKNSAAAVRHIYDTLLVVN